MPCGHSSRPVPGGPTPLASALVLRLPVTRDTTLRGLLGEVGDRLRAAIEHQDYPIELLADEFGTAAGEGDDPFADVLADAVRDEADPAGRPGFPLAFAFVRRQAGLALELRYRTGTHGPGAARRLLTHCVMLLDQATTSPDTAMAAFDLRSERRSDADRRGERYRRPPSRTRCGSTSCSAARSPRPLTPWQWWATASFLRTRS